MASIKIILDTVTLMKFDQKPPKVALLRIDTQSSLFLDCVVDNCIDGGAFVTLSAEEIRQMVRLGPPAEAAVNLASSGLLADRAVAARARWSLIRTSSL